MLPTVQCAMWEMDRDPEASEHTFHVFVYHNFKENTIGTSLALWDSGLSLDLPQNLYSTPFHLLCLNFDIWSSLWLAVTTS